MRKRECAKPCSRNLFKIIHFTKARRGCNVSSYPERLWWSSDMTVCVAAICRPDHSIIGISDTMVSNDYFSADYHATKIKRVGARWLTMFAGELSPVTPIVDAARTRLAAQPDENASDVAAAFAEAFIEYRIGETERRYLSPYGMKMPEFLAKGREYFGDSGFAAMKYEIDSFHVNVEFLLCGFSTNGVGHILTIKDPGVFAYHDMPGFHAIGSGDIGAIGMLYANHARLACLEETFYRVCEAKFVSEIAPGVGELTIGFILRPDGETIVLAPDELAKVKSLWKRKGRPKIPSGAAEEIVHVIAIATDQAKRAREKRATANSAGMGGGN